MNESTREPAPEMVLVLPSQYPGYFFACVPDPGGDGWSFTAQAKQLDTRPWCVVTTDPAEFGEHLSAQPGA